MCVRTPRQLNGRVLHGAQPIAKWKAVIDEELVKADARVKAGVAPEKVYEATIQGGKHGGPVTLTIPADAAWRGGANAKVVLHVFGDFQCPFCRRLAREVPNVADTGHPLEGSRTRRTARDAPCSGRGFHGPPEPGGTPNRFVCAGTRAIMPGWGSRGGTR
ncbi:MAG: thioredoxin domain-containing protein [Deltaproteobacteria bacterium]|nr:thioredoxin domain-containing protein [Deltaproteobacteria bacterium]